MRPGMGSSRRCFGPRDRCSRSVARVRHRMRTRTGVRASEQRAQALASLAHCRARIELARSSVFEAGDGVVDARMTALEREWLALSRAELALSRAEPSSHPGERTALAMALASDPAGIERAESCARQLASTLSAWGLDVGAAITWRIADEPVIGVRAGALLDVPLRALTDAIAPTYGAEGFVARAQRLERDVLAAAGSPLAADVAFVARIDFSWRACAIDARCVPAGHQSTARRDQGAALVGSRHSWRATGARRSGRSRTSSARATA